VAFDYDTTPWFKKTEGIGQLPLTSGQSNKVAICPQGPNSELNISRKVNISSGLLRGGTEQRPSGTPKKMRLINVKTLELKEFIRGGIPPYAILSHTWGSEEVSFQDMGTIESHDKKGFSKILKCCQQAQNDGYDWVWIDTCCIDKSSSAELSEAINSMYAWYHDSAVCYAYLEDVPPLKPSFPKTQFSSARWFTRGWCLQELLAPPFVEFYASDWTEIGTKFSLREHIEAVTDIPKDALMGESLTTYPIAQKMSWASNRQTTRVEDEAYCLLGIFDINMPLLYGEGRRAFLRLQEQILQQTEDFSLLLWIEEGKGFGQYPSGVLPKSPRVFQQVNTFVGGSEGCDYSRIQLHTSDKNVSGARKSSPPKAWDPPQMTSRGLRVHMFVGHASEKDDENIHLMWTGCMYEDKYCCILLQRDDRFGFETYARIFADLNPLVNEEIFKTFKLSTLYLTTGIEDVSITKQDGQIPYEMAIDLQGSIFIDEERMTVKRDVDESIGKRQYRVENWRGGLSTLFFETKHSTSAPPDDCIKFAVSLQKEATYDRFVLGGAVYTESGVSVSGKEDNCLGDRMLLQLRNGRAVYLALKQTKKTTKSFWDKHSWQYSLRAALLDSSESDLQVTWIA